MDSQHRHELHQHDLQKLAHNAQPFLEKYGVQAAVGLLAVVALIGLGAWWYGESSFSNSEGWTQFDHVLHSQTPSAGDYAAVVDKYQGTSAAAWAELKAAENYLTTGVQKAFTDREASQADLKKAKDAFQKLEAGGSHISPEIQERALFGLARCLESTCDGHTEDAIKVYSRLTLGDGMFKALAQERIKSLESQDTKDFYAWFHQQKPEPKDSNPFPFKKPEGDLKEDTKESLELDTPAGDAATKPAETQPAESKPAETKPEEKPADPPAANNESPEKKPESEAKPAENTGENKTP